MRKTLDVVSCPSLRVQSKVNGGSRVWRGFKQHLCDVESGRWPQMRPWILATNGMLLHHLLPTLSEMLEIVSHHEQSGTSIDTKWKLICDFVTGCIRPTFSRGIHHRPMSCIRKCECESQCMPFDKHRKCTTRIVEAVFQPQLPSAMRKPLTLLLRHTDGSAAATGGL